MWGFGVLDDSLDGLLPVVGGGLVQLNKLIWVSRVFVGAWLPDTLLGFETTGPAERSRWWVWPAVSPWVPECWGCVVSGVCCCSIFGGGVWCLICG